MKIRTKAAHKITLRAVVFQEGDWLCVQCLEYNLATQARTLHQLHKSLHRLILGHIAVRRRHKQRPFEGLPRAPRKYWDMFERSKISLPAQIGFQPVESNGVVVTPPEVRVAQPAA
jgi:hypothetical protein